MSTLQISPSIPPPLPRFDANLFRQKLAGLADPDSLDESDVGEMREEQKRLATELCLMLATHFNRKTLEAVTLWSRIGTALATASVKVQDGDMSRFCTLCLETVKAHPGIFAADEKAHTVVSELIGKSPEWRQSFVRYIAGRSFIIVILARAAWEYVKADRAAMWEQRRREIEAAEAEVANG